MSVGIHIPVHLSDADGDPYTPLRFRQVGHLNTGTYEIETTMKLRGGSYSAEISIQDGKDLEKMFTNYLGYRVTRFNSGVWQGGIITGMVYQRHGAYSRISLENCANKVSARFRNIYGSTSRTVCHENFVSQRRYGVIEKVLDAGQLDEAAADQLCIAYLERYAEPQPQIVGLDNRDPDRHELTIEVAGYAWLMTHRYPEIGALIGSGTTAGDLMRALLDDHPYLKIASIEANSQPILRADPNLTTLDYINAICDMGNEDGNPAIFEFDGQGQFRYASVSREPVQRFENGKVNDMSSHGDLDPNYVRPGVWWIGRVWRSGVTLPPNESWLKSASHTLIDEVSVSRDGQLNIGNPLIEVVVPGTGIFSDSWEIGSTSDAVTNPGLLLRTDDNGAVATASMMVGVSTDPTIDGTSVAIGSKNHIWESGNNRLFFLHNAEWDGAQWVRITAGGASCLILDQNAILRRIAGTGAAGSTITWAETTL